ncbi:hypothetical protein HK405_010024, partial [Cladochytrium tenue]
RGKARHVGVQPLQGVHAERNDTLASQLEQDRVAPECLGKIAAVTLASAISSTASTPTLAPTAAPLTTPHQKSGFAAVPKLMNSVGELPLAFDTAAALTNTRQILARFLANHDVACCVALFAFRPAPTAVLALRQADLLAAPDDLAAAAWARCIAALAIEGLRYYLTYDWLLLRSIIVGSYLAWMHFCRAAGLR